MVHKSIMLWVSIRFAAPILRARDIHNKCIYREVKKIKPIHSHYLVDCKVVRDCSDSGAEDILVELDEEFDDSNTNWKTS